MQLLTIIIISTHTIVKLIKWHKSFVERAQKEMGISNYALYWFGFIEGTLVMWLIMKSVSAFGINSDFPF